MRCRRPRTTSRENFAWSLLPIVFSSPDTDWAFGILPQVVYRLPGNERQSRVFTAAYYTLERQYAVTVQTSMWLNEDRDNLELSTDTRSWPTNFYGLSAKDASMAGIAYVERRSTVSLAASRSLSGRLRLGLKGAVRYMKLQSSNGDGLPDLYGVIGSEGGWVLSLGPSLGFDTRDHAFFPGRGWFVNAVGSINGYLLGGDYDYISLRIDARTYRTLSKHNILAAQLLIDLKSDGVPFWSMSGVGTVVRGYSTPRFLDRQLAAIQLEYRFVPLLWRLGFNVFGGIGTVAPRVDSLPTGRLRWAAGIGLRFVFMRGAKINIRWDFGFGPNTSGDYLDMAEAF